MAAKDDSSNRLSDAFDALDLLDETSTLLHNDPDQNTSGASDDPSDFVNISYPPPGKITLSPTEEAKTFTTPDNVGLTIEDIQKFFDSDGRIVEEHRFKAAIFKGGMRPEARPIAWPFLFKLYPYHSTSREREILLADYHLKYRALKNRWQSHLAERLSNSDGQSKLVSPSYLFNVPDTSPPPPTPLDLDPSIKQQVESLKIQAQVYAGRQDLKPDELEKSIHRIDKDVPRTDRTLEYFSGDTVHLRLLRDVLITYAMVNPDVGYMQGMNDIVSRFLTVFDSEVEAYWCFEKYMEKAKPHFMEKGLMDKLRSAFQLLQEMDPEMARYMKELEMDELTVCYRWMLLSFKREFEWEDSMKCFEILSTSHLELSGQIARKRKQDEMRRDFEKQAAQMKKKSLRDKLWPKSTSTSKGGKHQKTEVAEYPDFTFEVFMCVAILLQIRKDIFQCQEPSEIFALTSSKANDLNLQAVLRDAEVLFYKYCKQAAGEESFEVVEHDSMPKAKSKSRRS